MSEIVKKSASLASKFQDYRAGGDASPAHFTDFVDISHSFVSAYSRMLKAGMPHDSIAVAMLGATLNVYEMFGLKAELPGLLRELAEEIENSPMVN